MLLCDFSEKRAPVSVTVGLMSREGDEGEGRNGENDGPRLSVSLENPEAKRRRNDGARLQMRLETARVPRTRPHPRAEQ